MKNERATMFVSTEAAERQLDRLLGFFPRIDAKVSALTAMTFGQIAVAALNLEANDFKKWWIAGPAGFFALSVFWTALHLYKCAYPHLKGGEGSLIYFGEISKFQELEFVSRFSEVTDKELKSDIAAQIWRNSQVLTFKYDFLKRATLGSIISVIPWTALVCITSLTHLKIPGSS